MSTLTPLFEASLRGALLIGLLVLLRAPLRRFIGSPWLCALWLVVLVRLLLPGSIQSSWSVFNWWPQAKAVQVDQPKFEARVTLLPESGISDAPATTAHATAVAAETPPTKTDWLFTAWVLGVVASIGMLSLRILKTARMARSTHRAENAKLLEAFDSIPSELRKNVELRQVSDLEVPALVGLWRPQIWMPSSWLETMTVDELRHVLLHEIGHARRGDLLVQWLFAFAQCVHWFNPAVWLAARIAHADRELACDAWVLRRADLHEPEQYGATLVKAAQLLRSRWHLPPAAITMAMSKGSLFSRVRSIGQFQPVAGWRAVLGFVGIGLLLGSLATDRLHAQNASPAPVTDPAAAPDPSVGGPLRGTSKEEIDKRLFGPSAEGVLESAPAVGAGAPVAGHSPFGAGMSAMPAAAPSQVEIDARFIELQVPEAGWNGLGLNELSKGGLLEVNSVLDPTGRAALLERIANTVGVQLLSAPRVTTKSGQRAVIEIIREVRYATEFAPDAKAPDGLLPTSFETRNVGVTLEVEPTIGPDGVTIDLQLQPQIVELVGFTRVRDGQPIPPTNDPSKKGIDRILNSAFPKDAVVQPIFSTRKITTSITLFSGNTIALGGLKQEPEGEAGGNPRVLFVLITARVLPSPHVAAPEMSVPGLEPIPEGAGSFGGGAGNVSAGGGSGFSAPSGAMPGATAVGGADAGAGLAPAVISSSPAAAAPAGQPTRRPAAPLTRRPGAPSAGAGLSAPATDAAPGTTPGAAAPAPMPRRPANARPPAIPPTPATRPVPGIPGAAPAAGSAPAPANPTSPGHP